MRIDTFDRGDGNGGGQADRIVLNAGNGNDVVTGFQNNIDSLQIESAVSETTRAARFLALGEGLQPVISEQIDIGSGSDFIWITNLAFAKLLGKFELS